MWELLLERVSKLNEAKSPAEQAHELNLHHVGYGYWANENDEVVARTVDGHLIKLDPTSGKADLSQKAGDDDYGKELVQQGKEALDKLAMHAIEHLGLDDKPGLKDGIKKDLANTVIIGKAPSTSVVASNVDDPNDYFAFLKSVAAMQSSKLYKAVAVYKKWEQTQQQPKIEVSTQDMKTAKTLLEPFFKNTPPKYHADMDAWIKSQILTSKTKLAKGDTNTAPSLKDTVDFVDKIDMRTIINIMGLRDAIESIAKGGTDFNYAKTKSTFWAFGKSKAQMDAEIAAKQQQLQSPVSAPEAPYIPPPQNKPIQPEDAAKLIGFYAIDPKQWLVFTKLMKKAEEAETTAQLNYIGMLAKKAGVLGDTDDEKWNNWKKLLKYIKSTKSNLIQGAKEKGKIKSKKQGAQPTGQNVSPIAQQANTNYTTDPTQDPSYVPYSPTSASDDGSYVDPDTGDVVYPEEEPTNAAHPAPSQEFDNKVNSFDKMFNQWTKGSSSALPQPNATQPETSALTPAVEAAIKGMGYGVSDFGPHELKNLSAVISDVLVGNLSPTDAAKALYKDGQLANSDLKGFVNALDTYMGKDAAPSPFNHYEDDQTDELVNNYTMAVKTALDATGFDASQFQPDDLKKIQVSVAEVLAGTMTPKDAAQKLYNADALGHTEALHFEKALAKFMQSIAQGPIKLTPASEPPEEKSVIPAPPPAGSGELVAKAIHAYPVAPKALKAVQTSMNGWANGDDHKLVGWILKKYKADPSIAWQDMAMALVKDYNYPIDELPKELIPMSIEDAMLSQAPSPATSGDADIESNPQFTGAVNAIVQYVDGEFGASKNPTDFAQTKKAIADYVKTAFATGELPANHKLNNIFGLGAKYKIDDMLEPYIEAYHIKKNAAKQPTASTAIPASSDQLNAKVSSFTPEQKNTFSEMVAELSADPAWKGLSPDEVKNAMHVVADAVEQNDPDLLADLIGIGLPEKTAQDLTHHIQKAPTPQTSQSPADASLTAQVQKLGAKVQAFTPEQSHQYKSLGQMLSHSPDFKGLPVQQITHALEIISIGIEQNDPQFLSNLLGVGVSEQTTKDLVNYCTTLQQKAPATSSPSTQPTTPSKPAIDPYKVPEQIWNSDFGLLAQGKLTGWEKGQMDDAIYKAIKTGTTDPITNMYGQNDLDSKEIQTIAMGVQKLLNGETLQAAPQEAEPEPVNIPNEKATPEEAAAFTKQFMMSMGVNPSTLPPEGIQQMTDATMKALSANTEFGVHFAFKKLKDSGLIPPEYIDALKYDIIEKMNSEGKLDNTEGAFKKYLDATETVDNFLQSVPQFAANLSPEDKQKIIKAAEVGLQFQDKPGQSGYQQAKAYYNQELVGKIPGFDESVFQKFRNQLMQYHDELKQAEEFEKQQKAQVAEKKKQAQEVAKALNMLKSGDLGQKLDGIVMAMGTQFTTQEKQNIKLAVAKSLQAPTSQDMLDILDTLRGKHPLGSNLSGKIVNIPPDKFNILRNLVAATYFEKNSKDDVGDVNEPKVSETPQQRASHVLKRWGKEFGASIGQVPEHNGERKNLVNAVVTALAEPNPKKVNAHINSLLALGTSLSDKQINQLRQLVHQERQQPASLSGKTIPDPAPYQVGGTTSQSTIQPSLGQDSEFKTKLKYYGIHPSKAKAVETIALNGLTAYVDKANKPYKSKQIANLLMQQGMPADKARNMANWITLNAMNKTPLAQKAHALANTQNTTSSSNSSILHGGLFDDQNKLKAALAALPSNVDPHHLAKTEWVPGEKVIVASYRQWTKTDDGDLPNGEYQAVAMAKWRKQNLSPSDYEKFTAAANHWQSTGQWAKNAEMRKATNYIMTKTIEGPPPQLTKVSKYLERGMSLEVSEFKDFIKAFNVGQKVYLGPSGFSSNSSTPGSYSGEGFDTVGIKLRVFPSKKTGMLKAAHLSQRPEANMHAGENEIVIGTNDNTRVTNIIKHVSTAHGKVLVSYEIEMQYEDDDVNESFSPATDGFNAALWRGLSPATVKALIKYVNTPVSKVPTR